jgi:hypothetical protein
LTTSDYCREIEIYLCRKNDGHLVRVVGPSFDLVSRWAADGIPIKIAFRGIDRYVERYYRKGPRHRPVRIDFCEADVLDVFDEWRRALGLSTTQSAEQPSGSDVGPTDDPGRRRSLPAHLGRAVMRLTSARASGLIGAEVDSLIDRVAQELDQARRSSRGLRGNARRALIDRLAELDTELVETTRSVLADRDREAIEREVDEELRPFRERMEEAAYRRAREALSDRLIRDRFGLPTLTV